MVLRWLGWSTYEVAYDGKIILLDAFIDIDSRNVGLNIADVHHADAILIGHPHFDHILNAPQLSAQTGAPIFVAPAGRKYLEQQGVRPERIKYVRGGDKIEMPGFTVQTALAIHSTIDPSLTKKSTEFLSAVDPMSESERRTFMDNLKATTLADPNVPEEDIVYQGTIAYLITFADGTRVSFRDSPAAEAHKTGHSVSNAWPAAPTTSFVSSATTPAPAPRYPASAPTPQCLHRPE
jgi:Beta-lactamase superfamily domain